MSWLSPEEFAALFSQVQRRALRWECQGTYHEPEEDSPLNQWRRGSTDTSWMQGWVDTVTAARERGAQFQRVRVFEEPPNEYQRFSVDITPVNLAAGEDIRMVTRTQARELDMPEHDYWILDDAVVMMHFDDHGLTGVDLYREAAEVSRHEQWLQRVWPHALELDDYIEQMMRSV